MSSWIPSLLVAWICAFPLLSPDVMSAQGKGPEKMELYTAGDGTFALYKPPGWKVDSRAVENGKAVTVTDPKGNSRAVMRVLTMQDRCEDSTALVSRTLKGLRASLSGLDANFTILDPKAAAGQPGASPPRKNALDLQMTETVSGDRSFSLLVPRGWKLEGAKGQALCTTPVDGIAGFIASTISFWGPSQLPYFDSSRIPGVIHSPYRRPVDALILAMRETGSRNHNVLERAADPARARQAAAYRKRGADVETASLSFDSKTGVRCKGIFDVTAYHPLPSGQWGITATGIWSPEKEFAEYLPSLLRMAESFRINEQFAAEYVRRGQENLRRMTRETAEKAARGAREIRESSMAAYQERQRSMEYIDTKRTGYIRGEQEWLSEAEGGALYKSDHWGLSREGERDIEGQDYNYYNYKGKNPRYNETLTPVDISREVYESVYGK